MNSNVANIFKEIPTGVRDLEVFEELLKHEDVRIERICSSGQASPEGFWYDQEENEWCILLRGQASIGFHDGSKTEMRTGDHIFLPAHKKHRVAFTSVEPVCIWLAIYWK